MSIGIDVVQIDRMEKLREHPSFLNRVFTKKEQLYIHKKNMSNATIAGLYAAKEAVSKVFGTGIGAFHFHDVSIIHDENGAPFCKFHSQGLKLLESKGYSGMELSISHDNGVAIAVVVGLKEDRMAYKNIRKKETFLKDMKSQDFKKSDWHSALNLHEELNESLLRRDRKGYKSQYGKVAIIGGSEGMVGSICLSARAAFRVGAGLVYVLVPKSIAPIVQIKLTEAIVYGIEDDGTGYFSKKHVDKIVEKVNGCDCVAIGPGLGRFEDSPRWLHQLLTKLKMPIVLDADALYAAAKDPSLLKLCENRSVITPHEQEMSRLTGIGTEQIRMSRNEIALQFSQNYKTVVLLKGSETVITDGNISYFNNTGNPGMATAGSGDVLTGMIAGYLGYGYKKMIAVRLGAYIHGLAGDFAKNDKGEDGIIASDIVEQIPYVVKYLQMNNFKM